MAIRPLSLTPVAEGAQKLVLPGVNALRAFAAVAVIYAHISFFLGADLHVEWFLTRWVDKVLVADGGLNPHLSFFGVAIFMMITGLVITGSAMRHTPGRFLFNRIGRLLPAMWVAVAAAIVLVRLGVNGMFSGQSGISNFEAFISFFLGGFFLKPDVQVLGVTWTLTVQIAFFLLCMAARPLLRTTPIALPLVGAAASTLFLLYNEVVPEAMTVPMLSRIAATLPAVFIGQIIYLAWTRSAGWVWIAVAVLAQIQVVRLATDLQAYWAGDRYLWTMFVVAILLIAIARYDGPLAAHPVVHWLATRSYAIYLVHTLILYRVYNHTAPILGTTGAVLMFLIVLALVSEALYRWVEAPAAEWLKRRDRASQRRMREREDGAAAPTSEHLPAPVNPAPGARA
jgi:peptidoglycan/LPS O-acetylase OafA/YrhL